MAKRATSAAGAYRREGELTAVAAPQPINTPPVTKASALHGAGRLPPKNNGAIATSVMKIQNRTLIQMTNPVRLKHTQESS